MGPLGNVSLAQLLDAVRRGQRESLGILLESYRCYLHLLARTQMGQHLRAQANPSDLVQEAFLEAYRDFDQFRGDTERELVAWLRRILVHNLARLVEKHIRARKRSVLRTVSLDACLAELEGSAVLVCRDGSPSSHARQRERSDLLASRLALLPPNYREVIVLRNLEGLPFDQVARRMGRSSGAVRVLWLRALDCLRQLLQREEQP
jgi:RNA polymerase sigma-70 factor (ECF subfamily)